MMFGILMLLGFNQAGTAPATVVEPETSAEIIVIGRRARAVRWDWRVDRAGRLAMCRVTRSSGDSDIDRIGCQATQQCATRGLRHGAPMRACILSVRNGLIEALADARVEERLRRSDDAQH